MRGPTRIFWANLKPSALQDRLVGANIIVSPTADYAAGVICAATTVGGNVAQPETGSCEGAVGSFITVQHSGDYITICEFEAMGVGQTNETPDDTGGDGVCTGFADSTKPCCYTIWDGDVCVAEQATKAVCEADGANIDGVFTNGVWCPAPSGGDGTDQTNETVQTNEPGITSCSQVQAYCYIDPYAALIQESCPATCRVCPGCALGANGALTVLNTEAEICAGVTCEQAECCQPQQQCSESGFSSCFEWAGAAQGATDRGFRGLT